MPDYTTPNYTQPSNSSSSYYDWIRLGLAFKQYQDSKKAPQFAAQPMSPEQKAVLEKYMAALDNPALKNNAANVNARASTILGGYQNLGWQSPKTFSGDVGYAGTRSPFAGQPTAAPQAPVPQGPQLGGAYTINNLPMMPGQSRYDLSHQVNQEAKNFHELHGSAAKQADVVGASGGTPSVDDLWSQREQARTVWNPNQAYEDARIAQNTPDTGFVQGSVTGQDQTYPPSWDRFDPANKWVETAQTALGDEPTRNKFISFVQSQGVKDGAKVVLGFLSGGLAGAALTAVKVLWDRFSQGGKP